MGLTLSDQQFDTLLREAVAHISRKEFDPAERFLDIVLSSRPDAPNALYVLGQLRHVQNRVLEAVGLYRRALTIDPGRPEVQFHLGQALILCGQLDAAVIAFQQSIRLRPDRAEAHFELGMALSRKQDFSLAERTFREALRLEPNLLPAKNALSTTLVSLGRPKEAEIIARAALPQAANDARWYAACKHTIAIAISEQHRYDDAIQAYEEVQAIAPGLPFLDHNCANALQASGRTQDAEAMYRRALARDPLDLLAHRGLNQLLWRLDRSDFLESYDGTAQSHPNQPTPYVEKGRQLLVHDRNDEACKSFERAIEIAPNDERAREGLASALARVGRHGEAIAEFESIVSRWPNSVEVRSGLCECYLRAGESDKALHAAEAALACSPTNQLALALWSTALRQRGDERGLRDYESLIEIFDLAPPDGFVDLESFHSELSAYLNRLHGDLPPAGSEGLRLVGRTSGTIIGSGTTIIQSLRSHVDKAVVAYVTRLPEGQTHPFLRRRDKELRYAGSWSTRVAPGGRIANHIHDNGWLSAIYFVSLPDDAKHEKAARGWLKFGEPPFEAHLAKPVARLVKPLPGRLVLFPSYLWHGSTAFHSSQPRLTVAFDAVPEASRA